MGQIVLADETIDNKIRHNLERAMRVAKLLREIQEKDGVSDPEAGSE